MVLLDCLPCPVSKLYTKLKKNSKIGIHSAPFQTLVSYQVVRKVFSLLARTPPKKYRKRSKENELLNVHFTVGLAID